MNTTKIGWIGLGNMGIPMSQRLVKAGYPVAVFNRSKEKEATLQSMGAGTASSPMELLQQTDVILIMVSDDEAIREIFKGQDGLMQAKASGKIIINTSTVSPGISREFSVLCKQQGNGYLDAPVSGSVKQAEEGQLVIMAGGEASTYQKVKPILDSLGKLTMLVGDSGAGNTAKLAINMLLAFCAQGLSESVLFAKQHNIKTEDLLTLINNSALGSPFIKLKGEAIVKENYQAAFALKHIAKDLRLAKDEGLNSPLGNVVYNSFQEAEPALGEEDTIAVIKYLAGVD